MRILSCLMISLVFSTSALFAYDIPTLIADAKARYGKAYDEIVDMTVKQTGTVKNDTEFTTMTMSMYRKGDKWRNEATIGEGEETFSTTTIYDGTDYWSEMLGMKTKLPKEETEAKRMVEDYWMDIPDSAKMLGEESLNGRDCWIVEWNEENEPLKTWIAKDDFMHVQSVSESGGNITKILNSDFRKVHGDFMVPFKTDVYSGDELVVTSLITEFTCNAGLADSLFDPEKLGGSDNMDLQKLMEQAKEMQKQQGKGE
jgi:outer membrane lipoprotein-sorting protein